MMDVNNISFESHINILKMREIQILDFLHYKCNICIQRIQESEELRKHIVCMHMQLYENMKTTRNMET